MQGDRMEAVHALLHAYSRVRQNSKEYSRALKQLWEYLCQPKWRILRSRKQTRAWFPASELARKGWCLESRFGFCNWQRDQPQDHFKWLDCVNLGHWHEMHSRLSVGCRVPDLLSPSLPGSFPPPSLCVLLCCWRGQIPTFVAPCSLLKKWVFHSPMVPQSGSSARPKPRSLAQGELHTGRASCNSPQVPPP